VDRYSRQIPAVLSEGAAPGLLDGTGAAIAVEEVPETERLRAAVRATEQRLQDLARDLGAVVWEADVPSGQFRCVSGPVEAILGYAVEDWLADPDFWAAHLHPDDREPWRAFLQGVTAGRRVQACEYRVVAADGSLIWLHGIARRVTSSAGSGIQVRGVMVDISERKRAEEALRESEARLRSVVTTAPVVQFAVDHAGVVTLSEGKGLEILGLLPDDALGRSIFDLYRRRPDDLAYFRRALTGDAVSWVGSFDDATFEYRLTPTRDGSGGVSGVVGLAIDITARKQAEEARLALERKLLETQKLESLGVLAGGIAHDFNNLLVGVMGNASLALASLPPGSPAHDGLRHIEVAAQRAADLTRQLLAYAGKGQFVVQRLDLNTIVEEMTPLLRISIAKTARLGYALAERLPAIAADAAQIRQVLMNLVINASEAIGDGDGSITVGTSVVVADRALLADTVLGLDLPGGEYVCLEVADSGRGMDAATAARIFEPFFTTKFTGRGLGLAAVLGIVRGHKGALTVSSEPGQGTRFRVLLPTADPSADGFPVPPPASPREWHGEAERDRGTALLIDDEAEVRDVTAHMLERLGFTVLRATDGQEGVEVYRRHPERVVVVLLDMTMPHMTGEQALGELLRVKPDARVVLMSGYSEHEATRRFAGKGLAGFLQKPFRLADLHGKLQQVLAEPTLKSL